jgi:hypothetical protein
MIPEVVVQLRVRLFLGLFWSILHFFARGNINLRILSLAKKCKVDSKEPENRQNLSFTTTS